MVMCVACCLILGAQAADTPSEPPPLLQFECRRAPDKIRVDGNGDDKAWQNATPITDFRLWRTFGAPAESTSVRICYDDENLYALFECSDPDVCVLHRGRDVRIWESDCVELFLQPDAANPIYYEFEISPLGDIFDARFVNTGSGGFQRWAQWDCRIRTAVRVDGTVNEWKDKDKGYTVELAIPLEAFAETIEGRPLEGQTWRFAAVRVDVSVTLSQDQRSSTANVPEGDIHSKEGYFALVFR